MMTRRLDYYNSATDCRSDKELAQKTNPRYDHFKQLHFTVGDEAQFHSHLLQAKNGSVCLENISLEGNRVRDWEFTDTWGKYKDLEANAVVNTFAYIFHKFKKGIFVKIRNNRLEVFLPFSKASFTNEWSQYIKVDPKDGSIPALLKRIARSQNYTYKAKETNLNTKEWYANNCIMRYDLKEGRRGSYKTSEGDNNVGTIHDMLVSLCSTRKLPDIEFFINRRDFPILKRNDTEPYDQMWGWDTPLVSHDYPQYTPILSMAKTEAYADVAIPTYDDWARVENTQTPRKWFPPKCTNYEHDFNIPWEDKINRAVFRGTTTGCGVTIATNMRLKVAYMAANPKEGEDGYLDAKITKWNLRPRKLAQEEYLQVIDKTFLESQGVSVAPRRKGKSRDFLSPREQSGYKYIINIDGHVSAFRLSLELSMGSVVLLVDSPWKIWYRDILVAYTHYVPVAADLSDLISQIEWCREHDAKCQQIARNAKDFFDKFLQRDGVLDFLQKTLVDLKKETNVYLYNVQSTPKAASFSESRINTPLDSQLDKEYLAWRKTVTFPSTERTVTDVTNFPVFVKRRCYGLLQGMGWIVNMALAQGAPALKSLLTNTTFHPQDQNKLGVQTRSTLAGFPVFTKSTGDYMKSREHIHEAFIGTQVINKLSEHVPNFVYTFGVCQITPPRWTLVNEFVGTRRFDTYLGSRKSINEYLFIMAQICLALQVAQNKCCLVHWDLTPWNIVVDERRDLETYDYVLSSDKVVRVQTDRIPIIIDFGKSHVVIKGDDQKAIHHGYIRMFEMSTVQDIITLLVKSIDGMHSGMLRKDASVILELANFLSGTEYCPKKFQSIRELTHWLSYAQKYANLVNVPKTGLEKYTPIDLYNHILSIESFNSSPYRKRFTLPTNYVNNQNLGNGRQVFEYILSKTDTEREASYTNVCQRLKRCSLPSPRNLFFTYYAAQSLETNLRTVQEQMMAFFHFRNRRVTLACQEEFKGAISLIKGAYLPQIADGKLKLVHYDLVGETSVLEPAPYNMETFLVPKTVLKYLKELKPASDLSDYKDIIEQILLYSGTNFALKPEDRAHYLANFDSLLKTSSIAMQNNSANLTTLKSLVLEMYLTNHKKLYVALKASPSGNCDSAKQYLEDYKVGFEIAKT